MHYGGDVAAPVFSQVVSQTLPLLGVPRSRRADADPLKTRAGSGKLLTCRSPALEDRPAAAARWLSPGSPARCARDSRQVRAGDGFIAWPGAATDGRRFVAGALAAGATTCLVEREGMEAFGFDDARIASLPGLKAGDRPDRRQLLRAAQRVPRVVAATGTNGKTSTAWWTAQALTLLGRRCAVVGTLGIGVPPLPGRAAQIEFTGLTTPDPVRLHAALRLFADGGFRPARSRPRRSASSSSASPARASRSRCSPTSRATTSTTTAAWTPTGPPSALLFGWPG
jgi:hypothetical protein